MALAINPDECQRLRAHLGQVHETGVLFDTPRFVCNLETRLKALWPHFNHKNGLKSPSLLSSPLLN